MSNYTLNKTVSANIPVSIKNDCRKGDLDSFREKNWLKNYNFKEESSKGLIAKIVVCLALVCHSPCRGIQEFLEIVFDGMVQKVSFINVIASRRRSNLINYSINP
jgi:hypothetical protein